MIKKFLPLLLLLVALPVGVLLVKQVAEIRRGAAFDKVGLSILPSEKQVGAGQVIKFRVVLNSGRQKIDAVDLALEIKAAPGVLDWQATKVTPFLRQNQAFTSQAKKEISSPSVGGVISRQRVRVGLVNNRSQKDLRGGVINVAEIKIKTRSAGEIKVEFADKTRLLISGFNPLGGNDTSLEPNPVQGAVYQVQSSGRIGQRTVNLIWQLQDGEKIEVNKEFTVQLKLVSQYEIDSADLEIKVKPSPNLEIKEVKVNKQDFASVFSETFNAKAGKIKIAGGVDKKENAKSQMVLGTIKFKAIKIGNVDLEARYNDISSYNSEDPANSTLILQDGKKLRWEIEN